MFGVNYVEMVYWDIYFVDPTCRNNTARMV